MKTDELREKYLEFFASKGHKVCESDVLVPAWDKSVLFTPAGMNPFKDHFLGKVKLDFTRATSCQKCLRTGDIENVGKTAYHHTFFEMLGNFSFGDYFKREAIVWAWEFLVQPKWLNLDPNKLTVTVYLDDDEAADTWADEIGLNANRIVRMDEHDNFWPAGAPSHGPDGVCGPCSEIFFHPDGIGNGGEVEIWNLVFTQFNRNGDPPDNLVPLPNKNIDTGMGLERAAAALQGVDTNFHIDILRPIVEAAAEITGIKYVSSSNEGRFLRRITDHIRACTFAIHENVYPGPTRAEYVVRRLLRRCTLEGRQLGLREPFLFQLVPAIVQAMARPYPELAQSVQRIQFVIKSEESRFLATLDDGLVRIDRIFKQMKSRNLEVVDGYAAADLYQTFGIPPELVESLAQENGCRFDWQSFKLAMDKHSRQSGKFADSVMGDFGPIDDIKKECKASTFLGYQSIETTGKIVGLIENDRRQPSIAKLEQSLDATNHQIVVLDQTPFYAEAGGQVADTGTVSGPNGSFRVIDVQKNGDIFVHYGQVVSGRLAEGDEVIASVDADRRQAIKRAHTATHLLHHALQENLGLHAQQRGSKVDGDWLRFDFSHQQAISEQELASIESSARQAIELAAAVKATVLPLNAARQQGAMMLFGEKYPDPVRMVSIGDFSKELCGGTHVDNSSEIGDFEIVAAESVSAGTRRIEVLTGEKAAENRRTVNQAVQRLAELLQVGESNISAAVEQRVAHLKELKKQLGSGHRGNTTIYPIAGGSDLHETARRTLIKSLARGLNVSIGEVVHRVEQITSEIDVAIKQLDDFAGAEQVDAEWLLERAEQADDLLMIVEQIPPSNPNLMRQLIDQVRKKDRPAAIFLATVEGDDKVVLVAGVSHELVERGFRAGDWVKAVAPIVGGGGGGKPDLAQAGGKLPENIPAALVAAREFIATRKKTQPNSTSPANSPT